MKKIIIIILAIMCSSPATSLEYAIKIPLKEDLSSWKKILPLLAPWENHDIHYSCSDWAPLENTVLYNESFIQSRDCSQAQERIVTFRQQDTFSGEIRNSRIANEMRVIQVQEEQVSTGTKDYIVSSYNGEWSEWEDINEPFNCKNWSPDPSTIPKGQTFIQKANCDQNQERKREQIDQYASGAESINTENQLKELQVIEKEVERSAKGTKLPKIDKYLTGAYISNWGETENDTVSVSGIGYGYPNIIFTHDYYMNANPDTFTYTIRTPCGTFTSWGEHTKHNLNPNCNINGNWDISITSEVNSSGTGHVTVHFGYSN